MLEKSPTTALQTRPKCMNRAPKKRRLGLPEVALLVLHLCPHAAQSSVQRVQIAAPQLEDEGLVGVKLPRMCRLVPECASQEVGTSPGMPAFLESTEPAQRPGFFEPGTGPGYYCGWPGGFVDHVRTLEPGGREILRANST